MIGEENPNNIIIDGDDLEWGSRIFGVIIPRIIAISSIAVGIFAIFERRTDWEIVFGFVGFGLAVLAISSALEKLLIKKLTKRVSKLTIDPAQVIRRSSHGSKLLDQLEENPNLISSIKVQGFSQSVGPITILTRWQLLFETDSGKKAIGIKKYELKTVLAHLLQINPDISVL